MSENLICKECREDKDLRYFARSRLVCKVCCSKKGQAWQRKNRVKTRATALKWRLANKENIKNYQLHFKYGLTLPKYLELIKDQDNCCKICSQNFSDLKQTPMVDHCHTTGRVRGLLCLKCNAGIGFLLDSPTICEKACEYLKL